MKNYRAEQVTKYLIRFMHRGGRKFKRFKLDRRKFKEWLNKTTTHSEAVARLLRS